METGMSDSTRSTSNSNVRARRRPGPIRSFAPGTGAVTTPTTPSRNTRSKVASIEEWLEQVKPGYAARFAAAWRDEGGYHDLEDVLFDAGWLEADQLIDMLGPAGAKPVDIRRFVRVLQQVSLARQHVGVYEAAHSPMFDPRAYVRLCDWLDAVKEGYSRFAAAFAAAGYEDVDDLKADLPAPQQLQHMLAGITTAQSPQIEHLARALAAIASEKGGGGAIARGSVASQDPTNRVGVSVTPHKYLRSSVSSDHATPESTATPKATVPQRIGGGSELAAGAELAAGYSADVAGGQKKGESLPSSVPARGRRAAINVPGGKHVFLSYQWDVQTQIIEVKRLLNKRNIKCWMDIDGGMKSDIYDSMAEGVQGAACVICFMTQAYYDSQNCKLELKFAQQSGVPIVPAMMEQGYTAKGWLGILTAGSIWVPMHDNATVLVGIDKLIGQMKQHVPQMNTIAMHSNGNKDADLAGEHESEGRSGGFGAMGEAVDWGNAMFSLSEMREELERLREETAPGTGVIGRHGARAGSSDEAEAMLCPLPAMVPSVPRGLYVTAEMQSVLDAVLSGTVAPQVGFCGMGGVGKTTVSTWVVRNNAVRAKFGMVAWISLGQTPVLEACSSLLYLQLTGSELSNAVSHEQKQERLKQAFLNRSVLLVLDDCWDITVAEQFAFMDPNTNSKTLISSRVRDVLDGGVVIDVSIPSEADAVRMLLGSAGLDVAELESREEVAKIADMCKRLPLTIGVAGRLIRQTAQGSNMSTASDWQDVLAILEDELHSTHGGESVEESVIRASIKAIPIKLQNQVTRLFHAFALVPEDTQVPLEALGRIYDAVGATTGSAFKPISRLHVRQYLKVLLDRSLVLGTVDRPQLHDVMLDYVGKQFEGDAYKSAQRRLVDLLRAGDRSSLSAHGKYVQRNARHHVTEAYGNDEVWANGQQAICWLEDHVKGVQDVIATTTASILPAETLAKEAEAAGMFWKASLRWNALAQQKMSSTTTILEYSRFLKNALRTSQRVLIANDESNHEGGAHSAQSCTQDDLDLFVLQAVAILLTEWDPGTSEKYKPLVEKLLASEIVQTKPTTLFGVYAGFFWFPKLVAGDELGMVAEAWRLSKQVMDLRDGSRNISEAEMSTAVIFATTMLIQTDDMLFNVPGFSLDYFGVNGELFVETSNAYNYEDHHNLICNKLSADCHFCGSEPFWLVLQYGRVQDAAQILERRSLDTEKLMKDPLAHGYAYSNWFAVLFLPQTMFLLGSCSSVRNLYARLGVSFENAQEWFMKMAQDGVHTAIDYKVTEGDKPGHHGMVSSLRSVWQIKCMAILCSQDGDMVSDSDAMKFLQSLPEDTEFMAISAVMQTHEHGQLLGILQVYLIALALEKVGLDEDAIRFAEMQVGPLNRCGSNRKSSAVYALHCKGRALTKLNRPGEALAAFQTAVTVSQGSFPMVQAFAYRELARCTVAPPDVAAKASADLDAKLREFEGRLTRAEFDSLYPV